MSVGGRAPAGAAPCELGELRADGRGRERADERDHVPLGREPEPAGAGCIGQPADHPDTGVGKIGPVGASL